MEKDIKRLRKESLALPESPGVYMMKDVSNKIIYIGKAKVLKNRVSQYFGSQSGHSDKVRKMVEQVKHFEVIVTDSEFEALILECSLIKQHLPKYNVLLKDDKGYHYIKITNEDWPRISVTNKNSNDGSTYIGPYMSSWAVKRTVDEIRKIFLIPSCNRDFSKVRIKGRPCLNYYIKQCCAPCVGLVKHDVYCEYIKDATNFLKGDGGYSVSEMTREMNQAAEDLNFEYAAKLRDRIKAIKKLSEKQKVVELKTKNQDVIAFEKTNEHICFEVFKIRDGMLADKEEFVLNEGFSDVQTRTEFIEQFYSMRKDVPSQILIDGDVESVETIEKWLSDIAGRRVRVLVPKKGDKAKLVLMCKNNAKETLSRKFKKDFSEISVLEKLKECLNLEKIPYYIEAYDVSNLQGSDNVAGMVVYENGKPNKKLYKRFKIKTVFGQDDYESMKEVIERRLNELESTKLKDEKTGFATMPDLILLDGGKGHVKKVKQVLDSKGYNIPIFGMVKDNKHRTRAISKDDSEVNISKDQKLFAFISKIQDEVHRFTVSYHRTKRKNNTITSTLLEIPHVGKSRAVALFKHFKTISRIKNASIEELMMLPDINEKTALSIYNYFRQ